MSTWQLQDAKNKFSRLVEEAISKGPQIVTKHGKESVVVISKEDYAHLVQRKKPLLEVLKATPTADLDVSRSAESIREIEF